MQSGERAGPRSDYWIERNSTVACWVYLHWSESGEIDGRRRNGRILAVEALNVLNELSFIAVESAGSAVLDDSTVDTGVTFSVWQLLDDPCSDC